MDPFYAQERHVEGVRIRAHPLVRPAALREAARRTHRLLQHCPGISANLQAAGAELHIIGEDQAVTDLPMYQHMAGVPFDGERTMDERGRGYGGLFACTAEEGLLELPSARHSDHRDVCTHELAHTVFDYGLDAALRDVLRVRFAEARPRWASAYAGTNVHEFFAELSMWFVGSRGDYGKLPRPAPGRSWLRQHDPASFTLLAALYEGELEPGPVRWTELPPSDATRSSAGNTASRIVFVNRTNRPVERWWLDYQGERRAYEPVWPGAAVAQDTFATHPWVLGTHPELTVVAGPEPGRVIVRRSRRLV